MYDRCYIFCTLLLPLFSLVVLRNNKASCGTACEVKILFRNLVLKFVLTNWVGYTFPSAETIVSLLFSEKVVSFLFSFQRLIIIIQLYIPGQLQNYFSWIGCGVSVWRSAWVKNAGSFFASNFFGKTIRCYLSLLWQFFFATSNKYSIKSLISLFKKQ